jgi:hypothetical protein
MSEEETFKSIDRIIEYEIEYVSVVKWVLLSLMNKNWTVHCLDSINI